MKFKKTILPNGLRVVTIPMVDNPSATVLVMVEAGSKYEDKKNNGVSHFLEHMVFKGTNKRPKAICISKELESLGAHYNAFTSQEFTGYYAKVNKVHINKALDIVSDIYLDPLLETGEIEKEKGVIVEEIRMYNDMPQARVQQLLFSLMYGDQPAGWHVAGTEDNVKSFGREDIINYRKEHYSAKATTVFVSGSFDEDDIIGEVQNSFSGITEDATKPKLPVRESQSGPMVKTEFKDTDQTHIVIGFRTFSVLDDRIPAAQVLTTILGKGMSSRLFAKMRDDLGICYYIKTDHDPLTDHGLFTISAGLNNSRVDEGIGGILGECAKIREDLVSEDELKKAKDYISGTTMLELETSDACAEYCGFQEVTKGKIETPEEALAKVNKVTANDLRDLARSIFVNDCLNMATVGKFNGDLGKALPC